MAGQGLVSEQQEGSPAGKVEGQPGAWGAGILGDDGFVSHSG